jgi:DNA-binding GntR family transcriptional regulator
LKPDSRLNESELSRQLKVSRAPIREALRQLQEQGLVVHLPRRGMFVVSLTEKQIEKINRLRVVLESEALLLCRANLTPQNERKLIAELEKMENRGETSGLEAARLDLSFHRTIWGQTENELLEKMLTGLTAPLFAFSLIITQKQDQRRTILSSHRPLLSFIQGKMKKDQARQVIYEHIALRWGRWNPDRP